MLARLKRLGIISGLSATLLLAACGGSGDEANDNGADEGSGDADVNYGEEMGYAITGIEPGAGVFKASEEAVEEYGLEGWEVQASSSGDRKSTRLNSSHVSISYAVFCLKKKKV